MVSNLPFKTSSPPIETVVRFAIAAVVLYYGWGWFTPQAGGFGAQGPAPVDVAEVLQKKIRLSHEYSGRLVAVEQAEIRPRVSGVIEEVHFADGATVNAGDPLFTIDPRPYDAALQSAKARAELAEGEFKRAERLLEEKAIPQHEYDQKKNDVEVAHGDLTRAMLDMEYTQVRSPITGRVSRAEITKGNLVEAGGNAPLLATVVTYSPIFADFEMDEATYLEYARAHATSRDKIESIPVSVGLAGDVGAPHTGHIESFDNRLNPSSGTVRVRARLDNADGVLVPGLFAHIKLGASTDNNQLLITDRAVGTDQNKKFVIVVGADNKTQHREIKLGALTDDGLRVIEDGLKPGEKIIVNGMQRVMVPGQEVKPETVAMTGPADTAQKPADQKPADKKPEEVKPADQKPADKKPEDIKPEDVKKDEKHD